MIPAPHTRARTAAQPPPALYTRSTLHDGEMQSTPASQAPPASHSRTTAARAPHSRRPAASLTAPPSLRHFSSPAAARTRARKAAPGSEVPVRGGSPRRRCSMPRCTAARKARSALSRLASSASWPE